MTFARPALILVLALLALNAIAYGGHFVVSPAEGAREFGLDGAGAGTVLLVRTVGAGLLGFAGFALLALVRLARRRPGGLGVAAVLGLSYLGVGAVALAEGLAVDAIIYGGFGTALAALSALLWRSEADTRRG